MVRSAPLARSRPHPWALPPLGTRRPPPRPPATQRRRRPPARRAITAISPPPPPTPPSHDHTLTTAVTAALERTRSNAPASCTTSGAPPPCSSSSMPPLLLSSYLRMAVWRGCNAGVLEGGESRPPIEHACALFHQWATCDGWMARVTERRRGFIRVVICPQTDGALLGAGSSSSSSLHASNAVMQLAQPEHPVCARPRRPPFAQLVVCGQAARSFG